MLKRALSVLFLSVVAAPSFACDVWVDGYYRSDGTWVSGHCRSKPDGIKWNNYGPSESYIERSNPQLRDHDGDGIPNMYDYDDDNDGWIDEYDDNPYGE